MHIKIYQLAFVAFITLISACSQVQPWEREILAQEAMQITPDAMEAYAKDHIYFSKEAATGGASVGGGGLWL